jgi:hypothetical protein
MTPIRFDSGAPRVDLKYVIIVALLLAVILIVLTQLWLIERYRRIAAEEQIRELYVKEQLEMAAGVAASQPAASSPAASGAR